MEARVLVFLILGLLIGGTNCASFQFTNNCTYPIWVGTLSGAGTPLLSQTGFPLSPGGSGSIPAPPSWSGRFWGRTGCSANSATGQFSCATADCSTGTVSCDGRGPAPPVTLIEITLGSGTAAANADFYDISLVDGFNVPVGLAPVGGSGDCKMASCVRNVNAECPRELSMVVAEGGGVVVGCMSACEAFGDPTFCCTGAYASPSACGPTKYSELFKRACPAAYSYAYDDASSTFTCAGRSRDGFSPSPGFLLRGSLSQTPSLWRLSSISLRLLLSGDSHLSHQLRRSLRLLS